MSPPTVSMQVEVDLSHPAIQAAIKREAESEIAAAYEKTEDDLEGIIEELTTIRDALETARRHLTSPHPNVPEATIYIERALEAVARCQ